MAKKISGAEYPLAKIFSSEFEYVIPSYQRPYAWTVDQASELFDDLYDFYRSELDEGYFLGSIVLIKEEGKPAAEVIDGQQRLTTLTILLAALAARSAPDDRALLKNYIVEAGNKFEQLAAKPRLTLRERDKEFFAKYVQTLQFNELLDLNSESLQNESRKNIQANARLLLSRIDRSFGDNMSSLEGFVGFLLQRCFLVAVSTPSQQSAFRVFSVMNSRGLDLQPTDIIKADIIGAIESSEEQELYNEKWEDMEVELGRAGFNDLFAYVRMVYAREKAKKALLEEFRQQVLSQVSSPKALVDDVLEPYAEALSILRSSSYQAEVDAQKINTYLRWLNRIDNSDWVPAAMLFLSQQKNRPDYVQWFMEKLERLAACLHLTAKNVNERIERYSTVISELMGDHNADTPVQAVLLTEGEKQEMRKVLDGDIYTLTARRRNYLILRLDSFLSDGAASYDASLLTIEHVLPQTVSEESQWKTDWPDAQAREAWVHRLANLVPLNKRRNSQAQNYDFDRKKDAYFRGRSGVSSYTLTTQVLNEKKWTPEIVSNRQKELLALLAEKWDLTAC
ncbi:DUF262 domain-containing HNH endonuclease family protein [Marinobacter bryozoorum]|uniref:DUF262 domain-containing protein n=1 Tax=Marinobacter bryozoorum TaxID=256324 RepID=UPI002002AEAC|nr:DUF262 domain-containing protein [Marinobacter bryozoorum]MCK7545915.1 DUF262 domain-containing HNH endonuclease family protein [Marinobacter bryozoorum]